MEGKESLGLWLFAVIGSPILVNMLIGFEDRMGYSTDVQGWTAVAYVGIMAAVLWKNRRI